MTITVAPQAAVFRVANKISTVEGVLLTAETEGDTSDDPAFQRVNVWLRPHVRRGRPRWSHIPLAGGTSKEVFASVVGHQILDKMRDTEVEVDGADDWSLQGIVLVEVSEADKIDFESGHWQPNSLFTRVKRALDKADLPNTFRHSTMESLASEIHDIASAMADGLTLDGWSLPREQALQGSLKIEQSESEYTLSNGAPFYPRPVMEVDGVMLNDVEFVQIQSKRGRVPLLLGPGGTGKTSVVEAACDIMFTTLFTAETTTLSLSGRWEPHPEKHGEFVWGLAELVQSIKYAIEHPDEQVAWYGDEVMQTAPEVLVMLHSLMDHRRTLFIEEGPGKGSLKAPDNWSMVLSSNPNEPGSSIGRPFASRCAPLDYWTNWDVVEKAVGKGFEQLITVGRIMETMRRNREVDWAPAVRHCVAAAQDMQDLGLRYGLRQLLAQCDLETGKCESKDLRRLEQVINEVYGLTNVTKMTLE